MDHFRAARKSKLADERTQNLMGTSYTERMRVIAWGEHRPSRFSGAVDPVHRLVPFQHLLPPSEAPKVTAPSTA